jgi:hypothetical protein
MRRGWSGTTKRSAPRDNRGRSLRTVMDAVASRARRRAALGSTAHAHGKRWVRSMLGATLLSIGGLTSLVLVTGAAADELTDSLASIRRAMVGHWSGELRGTDASGEQFEVDDAFTFVVTSEDGLDSATWGADTLEIATYEGGSLYRIRNWTRTGRQNEIPLKVRIVEAPDASGNGSWTLELEQRAADGTIMETLEHFALDQNTLRMTIEMRPAGSDEPFQTEVTGTWSRETK